MKNFIGLNIKYLCENNYLSQDEFGAKLGLKKSVVGTYVRGISTPKIEVMQNICAEYGLTLDEFVNEDLYLKNKGYKSSPMYTVSEPSGTDYEAEKQALLRTIDAQNTTIEALKLAIDTLQKKNL
jgi:HTH-type transcriptional regulator / antitoxin PezA